MATKPKKLKSAEAIGDIGETTSDSGIRTNKSSPMMVGKCPVCGAGICAEGGKARHDGANSEISIYDSASPMRTVFNIVIGDYSNDGHGEKETYKASSAKSIYDVRAAYDDIIKLGIDLTGICCDMGDDVIPNGILQRIQDIIGDGFELTSAWYDEENDEYHIGPKQLAIIIVALLNHLDASLDVCLEAELDDLPELITGANVGYGLFGSM